MNNIKCILFDMGDIAFTTDWDKMDKEFIKKYNFSIRVKGNNELEQMYKEAMIGKSSIKELIIKLKPDADIRETLEFYRKSYIKYKILNPGFIELVKKLKQDYVLYAFTDTHEEHLKANFEYGFFKHFKRVFNSVEFGKMKSDPTVFIDLIDHLEFKPEQCLFVDDKLVNIQNAKKYGFNVIHYTEFPNIEKLKEKLKLFGIKIKFSKK